ncbi:MAG: hypothetical protein WC096_08830 [Sphaerochaetaceae bacterium]|jgi:hypothetical protein
MFAIHDPRAWGRACILHEHQGKEYENTEMIDTLYVPFIPVKA